MKTTRSYRKLISGDDVATALRYVKGSSYRLGNKTYKLSQILHSEEEDPRDFDLFVSDGETEIYWKTISHKTILEKEADVNFE